MSLALDTTTLYKLAPNVLFQKVAEETVILEPETGQYYTLDAVGTFMVEQLLENKSQQQVVDAVLNNYQVESTEVQSDLSTLIEALILQKLMVKQA